MKKILIVGPLLSVSGYGYHSRQIFDYFYNIENTEVSCVILPWGNTSWFVDKSLERGLIGKIVDTSIDMNDITYDEFDLGVHIQLPNEWNTLFARKNIGVSAYVETNICHESWINRSLDMDLVIVPSNFTKKVILDSSKTKDQKHALDNKVKVIPEYYHEDFDLNEKEKSLELNVLFNKINTDFNYLTVGHLTSENEFCDRKNLIQTLRYFCLNFKNNKDVGLILKTSVGRSTSIDRLKTREVFKRIIKEVKGESVYPKIYLLHGDMSPKDLYSLYTHDKVKCYLSLTKGEGYGLPLLESARCGLPIIATNWSGHLDFLDKDFLAVDYSLENIPSEKVDNNIFINNSKWAIVKKSSTDKQLNFAYKNINKVKKIAKKLSSNILNKYNKTTIQKKYDKVFKEYL